MCGFDLDCFAENVANCAIFIAALWVTDAVIAGDLVPTGAMLVTPLNLNWKFQSEVLLHRKRRSVALLLLVLLLLLLPCGL